MGSPFFIWDKLLEGKGENSKFQNATGSGILSVKSGSSNCAASNIPDDLCFSKFGTSHEVCPQTADNLRTFVCATRGTRKSAHCLWLVGHTPGTVQTWKDTEFDV